MFPGENENEHMGMILELRGIPKASYVMSGARWKHFFNKEGIPLIYKNNNGKVYYPNTRILGEELHTQNQNFISFIEVK